MAMRAAARLFTQSVRASAPLCAAGSSLPSQRRRTPQNAHGGAADAAAKEAERKAALSPLERLAEFGKDVQRAYDPRPRTPAKR